MLKASSNMIRSSGGEASMPLVESPQPPGSSLLCRAPSCLEDPQAGALEALLATDIRLLSDILAEESLVLAVDHPYPSQASRTLLHLALQRRDLEAARILLAGGASPHHYSSALQLSPLHVSVSQCHSEGVKLLLGALKPGHLEARDRAGRTPLLLAATKGDDGLACLSLLLAAGASVHPVDSRGGQGVLQLAATANCWRAVSALVEAGATASPEARAALVEKFGAGAVAGLKVSETQECLEDQLQAELDRAELGRGHLESWERLLATAAANSRLDGAVGTRGSNLAQQCAERGLALHLERLLERGADPNCCTEGRITPPLLLAAAQGRPEVLRVLVASHRLRMDEVEQGPDSLRQTVLHQVVRKPLLGLGETSDCRDYPACLDILLARGDMAALVNCQDILGNTALHYATQFWSQDTVSRLLVLGANIGLRNNEGAAPIGGILPATMEQFLDAECLQSEGNPTNEDFKITFNYSFLAPPRGREVEEVVVGKEGGRREESPETDVLWYMARSRDHRHLLKHPVITSFLALKWSRISTHYNVNIFCFTMFVAFLTAYIFSNYAGFSLGISPPTCGAELNSTSSVEASLPYGNVQFLWFVLLGLLVILAVREILQFSIAPSKHIGDVENILEIVLILLVGLLLFYGEPGCSPEFKRKISAVIILISWIELVTMVGRHPRLSAYNIYSTMFYRVLKTFTTFLIWYSLFLLAFGLGFYILLHEDNNGPDRDYAFFDHLGLCLVKTFSMFVGELEFSDIPFNSPFSYFFFLTFVFLIVVVLMNLLNGLAVGETGLIREEAEIHAMVSRVEVIAQLEATLLGDPARLLKGSGLLARLIPSCGVRRQLSRVLRLGSVFRTLTVSSGVLLFYRVLPSKKIAVQPNKPRPFCCGPTQGLDHAIGHEVVKSAKNLILRLQSEQQRDGSLAAVVEEVSNRQRQMDLKMDAVLAALEEIAAKLA